MTTKTRQQKPAPITPSRKPPDQRVPWGRAALDYRPGLFIKEFLTEHREACATDVYQGLSSKIISLNGEREKNRERPIRRPNYSSFARYFHWFLILGLVQRTGRREPAQYAFLQERVFYSLTSQGEAAVLPWADPIAATHPEFRP